MNENPKVQKFLATQRLPRGGGIIVDGNPTAAELEKRRLKGLSTFPSHDAARKAAAQVRAAQRKAFEALMPEVRRLVDEEANKNPNWTKDKYGSWTRDYDGERARLVIRIGQGSGRLHVAVQFPNRDEPPFGWTLDGLPSNTEGGFHLSATNAGLEYGFDQRRFLWQDRDCGVFHNALTEEKLKCTKKQAAVLHEMLRKDAPTNPRPDGVNVGRSKWHPSEKPRRDGYYSSGK